MNKLIKQKIAKIWPYIYKVVPKNRVINKFNRRIELFILNQQDLGKYLVEIARDSGVKVGENCGFLSHIQSNEPYLIEIGNNVRISNEVLFTAHDGSIFTFIEDCPDVFGRFGPIKIGDNCFIGMRATILPNVTIGNNCIIGAGAVVTKSFPDNCIIAGNPAKIISEREVHKKKVLNDKNTLRDEIFSFPNDKNIPKKVKKKKLLKHFNLNNQLK